MEAYHCVELTRLPLQAKRCLPIASTKGKGGWTVPSANTPMRTNKSCCRSCMGWGAGTSRWKLPCLLPSPPAWASKAPVSEQCPLLPPLPLSPTRLGIKGTGPSFLFLVFFSHVCVCTGVISHVLPDDVEMAHGEWVQTHACCLLTWRWHMGSGSKHTRAA